MRQEFPDARRCRQSDLLQFVALRPHSLKCLTEAFDYGCWSQKTCKAVLDDLRVGTDICNDRWTSAKHRFNRCHRPTFGTRWIDQDMIFTPDLFNRYVTG